MSLPERGAQLTFEHLHGRGKGQRVETDVHRLGRLVSGDETSGVLDHFGGRQRTALLRDDDRVDSFTPPVVRYADDNVLGFQHRADADRFLADFQARLAKFGLALHPDKTRLLEFGRFAAQSRRARGQGKPETFQFLGFVHACGRTRKGWFMVHRRTAAERLRAKLQEVKAEVRLRRHAPVPEVGEWLGAVVRGHCQYYGMIGNSKAISQSLIDGLGTPPERLFTVYNGIDAVEFQSSLSAAEAKAKLGVRETQRRE